MNKHGFPICIAALLVLITLGFSTRTCLADILSDSKPRSKGGLVRIAAPSRAEDPFNGISFPTIYKSGFDACTNLGGQPVVFLFSSSLCSHCEWLGKIFDVIVANYVEEGKIEAHHYDVLSNDDLFTEAIETEIPEAILDLYHRGSPKDLVPYLNFSCKYERVGNGYEDKQDTEAEGREIMEVIDTLIKVLSTK